MARLMSDGFWTTDGVGYLNQQHKTANAQKIYMFFSALGWSRAAICGLLGNIEIECRFDPQNIYGSLTDGAYGFTQWHPPTKLINWCNTNNIDYRLGSSQLRRI